MGKEHGVMRKDLATTYSRGAYRTTTIGKTVFDGRVRDGNGSGHSFMVTKKTQGQGRAKHDPGVWSGPRQRTEETLT